MKSSETPEEVNDSGFKALLDIAFDRLRNNFYGYLITSLILFNLENIILVFKSKDSIELTLIYIGLEKDFTFNYFWRPIAWGMAASIVMPVITALYAWLIGVVKAARDDSHPLGKDLWDLFKANMQKRLKEEEKIRNSLKDEIIELIRKRDSLKEHIGTAMATKENLDQYIVTLATTYHDYMNNNSTPNLTKLLNEIEKPELYNHIPNKDKLKHLQNFIKNNSDKQTENPPKEL